MVTLVSRPSFSFSVGNHQGSRIFRICFFVPGSPRVPLLLFRIRVTTACSAQVWNSEPLQVKMSMRFLRSGGCREVRAAAAAAA